MPRKSLDRLARKARKIIEEELVQNHIKYREIIVEVLPLRSVGVQGDERTYAHPVQIEIDSSSRRIVYKDHIERISLRITNEIKEINRVLYVFGGKHVA